MHLMPVDRSGSELVRTSTCRRTVFSLPSTPCHTQSILCRPLKFCTNHTTTRMPSLPRFGRPEFRCRNTDCALSRCSSPNACRLHRSPPRQFPPDARSKIERRPCPTVLPIGPHCPIALRPYLAHAAARSPLDRPATRHVTPPSVTRLARLTADIPWAAAQWPTRPAP